MSAAFLSVLLLVLGGAPGLTRFRDAGARMALLASGVLGGVADALREQKTGARPEATPESKSRT